MKNALDDLLEVTNRLRDGKIVSLAIVSIDNEGYVSTGLFAERDSVALIGAIEILKATAMDQAKPKR